MSNYKFDGKYLSERGSRRGRIDGSYVYDDHGKRIGKFERDYIYDSHGSRIGKLDGKNVYDGHGSRLGTLDDVKKSIDGPGGLSLVAMWLLLVR